MLSHLMINVNHLHVLFLLVTSTAVFLTLYVGQMKDLKSEDA